MIKKCYQTTALVFLLISFPRAKEFDVECFFMGFGKIRDVNLKLGTGSWNSKMPETRTMHSMR